MRSGNIQKFRDALTRQHAQDNEHPAGSRGARLQNLIRIDEEILAHRRHAQRRQHLRRPLQMLQRSIEASRLGQHRDCGGPGARVSGDPPRPILPLIAQNAGGGRAQLELGYHIEARR